MVATRLPKPHEGEAELLPNSRTDLPSGKTAAAARSPLACRPGRGGGTLAPRRWRHCRLACATAGTAGTPLPLAGLAQACGSAWRFLYAAVRRVPQLSAACPRCCRHPSTDPVNGPLAEAGAERPQISVAWRKTPSAALNTVQNEVSCDSPACLRPEIRAFDHGCMAQLLASGRVTCHASTIFMKPDFKIGRGRDDRRTLNGVHPGDRFP